MSSRSATATLDERGVALVAATREAMINAAKFAGRGGPIAVFAEIGGDGQAQVFVRDRGPGLRRRCVPADRRGVRESIIGRMRTTRRAQRPIRSSPGDGTEIELDDRGGARHERRSPSVVIVDDHGIFRSGVRAELEGLVEVRA